MPHLPSLYQQIIHLSRYSRWLPEEKRRETWEETVGRYFDFFEKHLKENCDFILSTQLRNELEQAVLNLEIMPSMRCMMTAGRALEKNHASAYNCSFLAIDSVRAFDEAMLLLMLGCGVGFSVERQYVTQLPAIPDELYSTDTTIVVDDSKIGWAKAFKEFLGMLYIGQIPKWDLSKIREAGTPLKTFGGTAAGKEPLEKLFKFTISLFQNARGRKLQSIECHDLMCVIGEIVVSGGKRRSALISLSNVSDDRMRDAKSGQWWIEHQHRALANNSACYTETPDMGIFLKEWTSLYTSKSGERGIFNLEGAKKQVKEKVDRRDFSKIQGLNPCITSDSLITTSHGPVSVKDLIGKQFEVVVNEENYPSSPDGFYSTGIKDTYMIQTDRGYEIKATENHKFKIGNEWKQLKDIKNGDTIKLGYTSSTLKWPGLGTYELGWLLGNIKGDGCISNERCYLRWWGDDAIHMRELATKYINEINIPHRKDCGRCNGGSTDIITITSVGLYEEIQKNNYGILADVGKKLTPEILTKTSSEFQRGFLTGWFDADGSIQGNRKKGISVRLNSSTLEELKIAQSMLVSFGIMSKLYKNRRNKEYRLMPDGNGGQKKYLCQANHELIISKDNMIRFYQNIGFNEPKKLERLKTSLVGYNSNQYYDNFCDTVVNIISVGKEEVFDCQIPDINCFVANGILTHNCGEILLRSQSFCNLSEVIIRHTDQEDDILRKARLAAILGTFQSTLTNFKYLRKDWKRNCEEERLLGVSMTGIFDNVFMSTPTEQLKSFLIEVKNEIIKTNIRFAKKLGIEPSTSCTTTKPSGTVSQMCDTASGIHPRYSKYYIRAIRMDLKDPMCQLMKDNNLPYEIDCTNSSTVVFYFPIKSPDCLKYRSDLTAIEHLELYLIYKQHYTEHSVSITVSVKEHEWLEVGAWVYKHFDDISGVSFLPHSDHIYQQAPYQECTEEEYQKLLERMPKEIDWNLLSGYEDKDMTTGSQEYACGGKESCDII